MNKTEELNEIETYIYKRTKSVSKNDIIEFLDNFDKHKFDNIKDINIIRINTSQNYIELIFNDFNYYINKRKNEFIKIKKTDINLIYTIDTINKIKDIFLKKR